MEYGLCLSRGPRIGPDGVPCCKLPEGHDGPHKPDPEDGWGNVQWGGSRGQSQASLNDQLETLYVVANQYGYYDAADFIQRTLDRK
jgi:hypothetical protein